MYLIRSLIIGDSNVGKTSLLVRMNENSFTANQSTTIGVSAYLRVAMAILRLQIIYIYKRENESRANLVSSLTHIYVVLSRITFSIVDSHFSRRSIIKPKRLRLMARLSNYRFGILQVKNVSAA